MSTAVWTAMLAGYAAVHGLVMRPPAGRRRRSLVHWRWPLIVAGVTLPAWGAVELITEMLAFRAFREPITLAGEAPRPVYDWAVVIGRRAERSRTAEVEIPSRNSPLGLHERSSATEWVKRRGDLLCRSTTTAHPPDASDRDAVLSFSADRGVLYRWGHVSVPFGFFSLTPTPWRTGDTAFLISDLYSSAGTIALESPQVLTVSKVVSDEETGEVRVIDDPAVEPIISYVKEYCHLHPSWTRDWSHRDSLGCINLCALPPRDGASGLSDWRVFFSWFEELGLLNPPVPLALVVQPFEALASAEARQLPDRLVLPDFQEGVR